MPTPPPATAEPATPTAAAAAADEAIMVEVRDFSFYYNEKQALHQINLRIPEKQVTAFIGPSGCGKTTLLRNLNRMNDLIDGIRHEGDILLDGTSLYDPSVEVISLRKRVGMVFQKYNPFPKSIYENIVFSLRVAGRNRKSELDEVVERSLRGAALWDEVKDRLQESAYGLSGGQQQRLCIARAIANRPQILLMDEPCAALDPIATLKIEELMHDLKKEFTMRRACPIAPRSFIWASSSSMTAPPPSSPLPAKNKPRPISVDSSVEIADHGQQVAAPLGMEVAASPSEIKIEIEHVDFAYGSKLALQDVHFNVPARQVTALIGPSGCGKSTILRCLNRMNDVIPDARITRGQIRIGGQDIYDRDLDVIDLRRRVGMVFQKSNPFPKSIYDNVAYGLRIAGETRKAALDEAVERSLRAAALWEECKDRLGQSGFGLSGGQQQRLCIARAIAVQPEVLLMDEPCSALDPIATLKIEELIAELKRDFTIVIVTHNMQQATRCSDRTAFFYLGSLIEEGPTDIIFNTPREKRTEEYISGRFG